MKLQRMRAIILVEQIFYRSGFLEAFANGEDVGVFDGISVSPLPHRIFKVFKESVCFPVGRAAGGQHVDFGLHYADGLAMRARDFEIEGVSGSSEDLNILIGCAGRTISTDVAGKGRVYDAL